MHILSSFVKHNIQLFAQTRVRFIYLYHFLTYQSEFKHVPILLWKQKETVKPTS